MYKVSESILIEHGVTRQIRPQ